ARSARRVRSARRMSSACSARRCPWGCIWPRFDSPSKVLLPIRPGGRRPAPRPQGGGPVRNKEKVLHGAGYGEVVQRQQGVWLHLAGGRRGPSSCITPPSRWTASARSAKAIAWSSTSSKVRKGYKRRTCASTEATLLDSREGPLPATERPFVFQTQSPPRPPAQVLLGHVRLVQPAPVCGQQVHAGGRSRRQQRLPFDGGGVQELPDQRAHGAAGGDDRALRAERAAGADGVDADVYDAAIHERALRGDPGLRQRRAEGRRDRQSLRGLPADDLTRHFLLLLRRTWALSRRRCPASGRAPAGPAPAPGDPLTAAGPRRR